MNISDKSLVNVKKVVTTGAFACQKFPSCIHKKKKKFPSCIIKANERESNTKLVYF